MIRSDLIGFVLAIVGCILVAGCENNLQDVKDLSYNKNRVTVNRSYGVEIIYSDSAIVKSKLITKQAYHFTNIKDPYWEMSKGITVILYDPDQKEKARITADYCIWRENQKIVDMQKNVIVTNSKGETLKTDQIIWDQNTHKFYSDKFVTLTIPNNTGIPHVLYGDGFTSGEDFIKDRSLIGTRGSISVEKRQEF